MSITHNLSTVNDNLSGFDPVADELEGTAIGRSWLLWKLFEGFAAFDSTAKKITNAAPTPTFLQGEVGSNLQTEPAKNRATVGDSIRYYHTDDPGLSLGTPSAMIYEWRIITVSSSGYGIATVRVRHLISGGSTYAPGADNIIAAGNSTSSTMYRVNFTNTTTSMINVPKVIFYKTSNMSFLQGIDKTSGASMGYLGYFNPVFNGYKHNVGSITEDGLNHRATIFTNEGNGVTFVEAISQTYNGNVNGLPTGVSPVCLTGSQPTGLFTFNSVNNLIGSYLRFGLVNDAIFKSISDQIEGVLLANPTAAAQNAGQIYQYNTKWYLHLNQISDGRNSHKILLELGT